MSTFAGVPHKPHPMTAPLHTHKDLRTLLLCALYAFVLLFFLSPDSYIRDLFYRCDSAWFFMCGKAWMNGLTPYVDFSDSKGPLLWLIYGVGYLLSHHSYIGVFWISVVFYTATLYIAYKLSRLFLEPRPSALCVAILPLALLYYQVHVEVRAEDYCYTFILLSLHSLCRIIGDKSLTSKELWKWSIAIGLCFAACLLIKWNIAGMVGSVMLVAFILSVWRRTIVPCLGGMVVGAAVLVLPFVIYFLIFADLGVFVQEYFLNTFRTMDGRSSAFEVLFFGRLIFTKERLTIILFIGLLLFCWKRRNYAWLFVCFFIFRIGMGLAVHSYYYAVLSPFFLFFLIAVVGFVADRWARMVHLLTPVVSVLAAVAIIPCNMRSINRQFRNAEQDREAFYVANYIMAQVEQPKLLWYNMETGLGTPVDALPVCRYWTRQIGATDEMLAERDEVLRSGEADFVIVYPKLHEDEVFEEVIKRVEAQGYVPYLEVTTMAEGMNHTLLGRPGLKFPPEDFHVSQWDIWLKRNIFGI